MRKRENECETVKAREREREIEVIPDVGRVVVFHPCHKVCLHDRLRLVRRNLPQRLRTFSFAARKLKVKIASGRVHFQHLIKITFLIAKRCNFHSKVNSFYNSCVTIGSFNERTFVFKPQHFDCFNKELK